MVQKGHSELILGPILDPFLDPSEKPHEIAVFHLHLAVGRALRLNIDEYGPWEGTGLGTGIALPGTHPRPIPRVHPPYPALALAVADPAPRRTKPCRGAHIRPTTLFMGPILRVPRYYRGL